MDQNTTIDRIAQQSWLGEAADAIRPAVLEAFEAGGEAGREIKNFLHGTWLGHPLHPVITDIPIGAWTTAAVLDGLELLGEEKYAPGADAAVSVGLAGAMGAAVTGLTDWSGTTGVRSKIGLMHALLNVGATALYATSLVLRRRKATRGTAIGLSMLGYGVVSASAYLGGHLVYGKQVGVDHTATADTYPKEFVAVLPENELAENTMRRVEAGEVPVLLARKNGEIFAIAHTCSHLGGPLSEGRLLDDGSVQCPWHGSVFSLKDGSVQSGPATEPQPSFDVRVNAGQIEVRLHKPEGR
ncbi:Rieske 2Fe-2S domain-containing protein [Pontibacter russatus]|uniref:Rieske 2Fe-2S domain-containing protein n=1 Tax=Pontibacter russatus TaxID=2694929 RepID=UPI0013799B43|nr:Rieske 2Fe-2S domain-containing protein [Pontibacter russatus]